MRKDTVVAEEEETNGKRLQSENTYSCEEKASIRRQVQRNFRMIRSRVYRNDKEETKKDGTRRCWPLVPDETVVEKEGSNSETDLEESEGCPTQFSRTC